MPDVPYFCYSHLIAKITVASTPNVTAPKFDVKLSPGKGLMGKVLNDTDIANARARISAVRVRAPGLVPPWCFPMPGTAVCACMPLVGCLLEHTHAEAA